jgi:hypothetical protein
MSPAIAFLISLSILLPLIAGFIRINRISMGYLPFFWMIVVGSVTEMVNFLLIRHYHRSNAVPSNINILIEWLLIAWQFHQWGLMRKNKRLYYLLLFGMIFLWVIENLLFRQITVFSPYFRFFYSFLIVLCSVNEINFMITHKNRHLFSNPRFLICIGFIIYYMYKIIYEWAYQISLFGRSDFTAVIEFLFDYINAFTNIIYAIALLLIHGSEKFKLEPINPGLKVNH